MNPSNSSLFTQVKAVVSMQDAVRFCGLEPPMRGNMRCPFHDDHNPSLTLYADNYYCWGCGAHGDVIDFTARHFRITQLEAAKRLASYAGLENPAADHTIPTHTPALPAPVEPTMHELLQQAGPTSSKHILLYCVEKGEPFPPELFAFLSNMENGVERQAFLAEVRQICREQQRLTKFNQALNQWIKQQRAGTLEEQNCTAFTDAPLVLRCGSWMADDSGVYLNELQKDGTVRRLVACSHPILPVRRLVNVQSGEEKLELAFYRDDNWNTLIVPCQICYNQQQITMLARMGVLVSSESARYLVRYLLDVVSANQQATEQSQALPRVESLSQLGWHGEQFCPYTSPCVCDTSQEFMHLYRQLHSVGEQAVWYELVRALRQGEQGVAIRMIMAASLSSVLLEPLGTLPYIFHIWGGSGLGKTVSLQLAMSIWGNPEQGALLRTMHMTPNAMARTAAFLHNLPLAADELQQVQNVPVDWNSMVMYLTEGMDKSRAKAEGGIETLLTWQNCFLFTGEQPLLDRKSGGGTHNRVLELRVDKPLFSSGFTVSNILREHYGWAGKQFVQYVQALSPQRLRQRFAMLQQEILRECNTSEKQAASMAALLLADDLACESIFAGEEPLQIADVQPYLQSKEEIDVAARAYEWCCNWVAANPTRFQRNQYGELWGKIADDGSYVMVNRNVLADHLERNGYNYTATLRQWDEKGWVERNSQGRYVHAASVFGNKTTVIKLMLLENDLLQIAS